jgi:hypothetical protein
MYLIKVGPAITVGNAWPAVFDVFFYVVNVHDFRRKGAETPTNDDDTAATDIIDTDTVDYWVFGSHDFSY